MSSLEDQFAVLDRLLTDLRQYWQCVAFSCDHIPWPELEHPLSCIADDEIEYLDANPCALYEHFLPFIPALSQLQHASQLPQHHLSKHTELPFWLSNGIKGRKLEQLQAFVARLDVQDNTHEVLEWCAGKGHLGRLMAHRYQVPIHSVELQGPLCEQGEQLAQRFKLPIRFTQCDVLKTNTHTLLDGVHHAVALHACGGLHQKLMHQAISTQVPRLSISPCCYHLFLPQGHYQPMSKQGSASALQLTQSDMKLALQQTVTAGQSVRRTRQKEVTWRLGFDRLVRDIFKREQYTPVPSVGKQIFSTSFAEFCHWAGEQKQLTLPNNIDFDYYLALGAKQKQLTDRIELVRHLFRRAIEVWLVLDRALYLQQAGYAVDVTTFCDTQLTPRNILIEANLKESGNEKSKSSI